MPWSTLDHAMVLLAVPCFYLALNPLILLLILSRKLHSTQMVHENCNFMDMHAQYISFLKLDQNDEKWGQNPMHFAQST